MLKVRRVAGHSMQPTLTPGSIVVFRRTQHISAGDIVLARDSSGREIVKRVHAIAAGMAELRGDNPSPRHNAIVSLSSIHYKKTLL